MASGFPLRWQAFRLPKQGNAEADYEDAAAGDAERGRFAVADGASEASFAAIWARLLVEGFVNDRDKPWHDLEWVGPLRQKWASAVDGMALPWYAEEKRELGAFAAFAGLAFRPSAVGRGGYWRAIAVGDCCLFHSRGGRVIRAFPLERSTDFDNRPRLICSRGQRSPDRREIAHGRWQSQDRFLLMSDALAQWFLLRAEQGHDPLAEISDLLTETGFADWISERRRQTMLRNDDVTLIVVDVE